MSEEISNVVSINDQSQSQPEQPSSPPVNSQPALSNPVNSSTHNVLIKDQYKVILASILNPTNQMILGELNSALTLVFDAFKSKLPQLLDRAAIELINRYPETK